MLRKVYDKLPKFIRNIIYAIGKTKFFYDRITYGMNGLYTRHNSDFMNGERFKSSFQQACEITGIDFPSQWKVHVNCWAIKRALNESKGDLVECGVWQGTTSLAGMMYSGFIEDNQGKKFYLVDSWDGVDMSNLLEGESVDYAKKKKDRYSGQFSEVEARFGNIKGVNLVKGFVPEVLTEVNPTSVSYIHLDMNSAYPEVEALKYFWDKLDCGAVIILDDYGYTGHSVQKTELDKLVFERGSEILTLPTGQGLIVKA